MDEDFCAYRGNGRGIKVVGSLQVFVGREARVAPAGVHGVG